MSRLYYPKTIYLMNSISWLSDYDNPFDFRLL